MVLLEPHSLSIALLDWTIKQKRRNRNMGNVCVFALNFSLCSKSWYRARRDCKINNNALETLSSDKKKEAVCRILRFCFIIDHFLFPYFFNLHSILHPQFLHLF